MDCIAQAKGRSEHCVHHGVRSCLTIYSRAIKETPSSAQQAGKHSCNLKPGPDWLTFQHREFFVHNPCLLCDDLRENQAGSGELQHMGLSLLPYANILFTFIFIHSFTVKCGQLCQLHLVEIDLLYCCSFCCSQNLHLSTGKQTALSFEGKIHECSKIRGKKYLRILISILCTKSVHADLYFGSLLNSQVFGCTLLSDFCSSSF